MMGVDIMDYFHELMEYLQTFLIKARNHLRISPFARANHQGRSLLPSFPTPRGKVSFNIKRDRLINPGITTSEIRLTTRDLVATEY